MTDHRGRGWLVFSGILLILGGLNLFFNGWWAIAKGNDLEDRFSGTLLFADNNLDVWGWIYLIIGALVVIAGIALFGNTGWARLVAMVAAFFAAFSAFFWLFSPYWPSALVSIALALMVLYGLAVTTPDSDRV